MPDSVEMIVYLALAPLINSRVCAVQAAVIAGMQYVVAVINRIFRDPA